MEQKPETIVENDRGKLDMLYTSVLTAKSY